MRRSLVKSVGSHILVALVTGVLVSNLHAISHHSAVTAPTFSDLNADFHKASPRLRHQENVTVEQTTVASTAQLSVPSVSEPVTSAAPAKGRPRSTRIDFSCPSHQLKVAPRVNYLLGMGHRMTETFYVLWYALTHGYCFCFPVSSFGADTEVFRLLLEAVIPECPADETLQQTSIKQLEKENITTLSQNSSVIQWIYPEIGDVWNRGLQGKRPRGLGDVISFIDHFLRDNHLMEDAMYPWYQQHKTIQSAFRKRNTSTEDETIITAAFHLRVGDLVLDASEQFWRNILKTLKDVVDLEKGPNVKVEIYWLYFKAIHTGARGVAERDKLSQNAIGEWPSQLDMLPSSHTFLATLCQEFENIECLWKSGTNMLETIDLFIEADVVYVSGSSLAQVLSLFNRDGIKLIGLPKELNWNGGIGKGEVPFLQTSTGGFVSLRYYYIDGSGALFDEHQAYLKPIGSSKAVLPT